MSTPPPPRHMGRVVDPSVADDDDDDDVPIEQLSQEPPPVSPRVSATAERTPTPARAVAPTPRPRPVSHELLLDPGDPPPPIPQHKPRRVAPSVLSPGMTAVFGTLFGLAGLFALFAMLMRFDPHPAMRQREAVAGVPPAAGSAAPPAVLSARPALHTLPDFEEEGPTLPGPWRITELKGEPAIRYIEGTVGLTPFVTTLQEKGLSKKETYRVLTAFKAFDVFKRPGKNDVFRAAVDRASGKLKAFELVVSATDIYQARENEEGLLSGIKLDMKVASRRRETSVRIGEDLAASLHEARLRDSIVGVIDAAFDGRASVGSMPRNSTLRLIVQEKTALGRFAGYEYVEALEYVSAKDDANPMRLYRFKDGHRHGYFDQKGREPYRGGWRNPCPGAPISSLFNPKRLHPVLKVVRPHNGVDYAAPTGTPIHATTYGTVSWVGPQGPAGNLVIIEHPGKIDSYYMHLSRFASGLKKGDKVESFQVIGFVGTTGRSTGPHLHFGIKKKDVWIDPLSLKMDGFRLVTANRRPDFEKTRAEYDPLLDQIALPTALLAAAPAVAQEPAGSGEDDDDPGDEDPVAPPRAAPPAASPVNDDDDDDDALEPDGFVDPNDRPDPVQRR